MDASFLPSDFTDGNAQTDTGLQQMVTEFIRCSLPVEVLPGGRGSKFSRQMQTLRQSVATNEAIGDSEWLLTIITVMNQSTSGVWDDVPLLHTVTMRCEVIQEVHVQVLVIT